MGTVRYTNFNGQIIAESRNGVRKTYRTDALSSVVGQYDNTLTQTYTASYWAYGETRTTTGSTSSKFGYVGGLGCRAQADGGIYMRARILETETCQWLTVDPLWPYMVASYTYGKSCPASYVDHSGLVEVGPIRGGDWPSGYSSPIENYAYGNYCGKNNWKRGCDRPAPRDCIDLACQNHDDCLDKNDYWTIGGSSCHCNLAASAYACMVQGCSLEKGFLAFVQCRTAAKEVYVIFLALCPTTGIIGIGKGAADGIRNVGRGAGIVGSTVERIWPSTEDWFNYLR